MNNKRQSGFALVMALFTLIVLAATSVTTFVVARESQHSVLKTFLEIKTYNAALSGLEWAKYRAYVDRACTNINAKTITIDNLTVTLECNQTNTDPTVYLITSQANTVAWSAPLKDTFVWRKISLRYNVP